MPFQYNITEGVPEGNVLNSIAALVAVLFNDGPILRVEEVEQFYRNSLVSIPWVEEAKQQHRSMFVICFDGDRLVGFKMGYQIKSKEFYSWLGGVRPDYRNRGIASELMKMQHNWCKDNGYESIRTETMNRFRNMLVLNLHHGYNVTGTYTTREGDTKIILEKFLLDC